jgi:hypothetical protein
MNKIFYAFLLCLPFCSFAQETEYTDQQLLELMAPAGKVHNEALDEILETLKSSYGDVYNKGNSTDMRTTIFELIDKSTIVLVNRKINPTGFDFDKLNFDEINNRLPEYLEFDLPGQVHVIDQGGTLSPAYYEAESALGALMTSGADCAGIESFQKLGREKIGALKSPIEKALWATSVSVAYYSTIYWKENAGKWQQFFHTGTTMKADPGRDIAVADVSGIVYGAVSGGAYGAIGGTVTFPGVGTVAGAAGGAAVGAITGGIGGSAKAAVSSFFNWLMSK